MSVKQLEKTEIACLMFEGKVNDACGGPQNVAVVEFEMSDTPRAYAKTEHDFLLTCNQISEGGKHGALLLFKDVFIYSICFHGHFLSYFVDFKKATTHAQNTVNPKP